MVVILSYRMDGGHREWEAWTSISTLCARSGKKLTASMAGYQRSETRDVNLARQTMGPRAVRPGRLASPHRDLSWECEEAAHEELKRRGAVARGGDTGDGEIDEEEVRSSAAGGGSVIAMSGEVVEMGGEAVDETIGGTARAPKRVEHVLTAGRRPHRGEDVDGHPCPATPEVAPACHHSRSDAPNLCHSRHRHEGCRPAVGRQSRSATRNLADRVRAARILMRTH